MTRKKKENKQQAQNAFFCCGEVVLWRVGLHLLNVFRLRCCCLCGHNEQCGKSAKIWSEENSWTCFTTIRFSKNSYQTIKLCQALHFAKRGHLAVIFVGNHGGKAEIS